MTTFDDQKTAAQEIAWAAGLFEGEGCIVVEEKRGVILTVSICDRDILERFVAIAGCGGSIRETRRENPRHRPIFTWSAYGRDTVELLRVFLPWFGERRRSKAIAALERALVTPIANRDKTRCPKGHPYDEENTYYYKGARRCRTCNREECRARSSKAA